MSKEPLITIIIPSYNHSRYISHTIQSILDQTVSDFELIIVDDCSSDDSVEIIKKFDDKRITLITLQKNVGMCEASNIAIAKAKGKYISIIASDDIMLPTNLEKKINFLEENQDHGAVFSQIEVIDENSSTNTKKTKKFEQTFPAKKATKFEWLNHFFFKGNCIAAPTLVARTSCIKEIKGFNALISQAHDFDMWVRICLAGHEIAVLPEKLVKYRQYQHNMSANTSEVRKRLVFDNEKILENYLSIRNIDLLVKIFPNLLISKDKITENLIGFFLAKEAMKTENVWHYQFALETLFKLMNNDEIKKDLEKNHSFASQDFCKLVTNNPLGIAIEKANQRPTYRALLRKIAKIFNI